MLRRWLRRLAIALAAVLAIGAIAYGALFIPGVYFRAVFFVIQRNALMRDRVDWPAVRQEADRLRQGARSTRDTYPAIHLVLRRLGDNHSHFVPPEGARAMRAGSNQTHGLTALWPERVVAVVSSGGPAERAGVRPGDVIESVDGEPPKHVKGVVLLPWGRPVSLRLRRGQESIDVRVTPEAMPFNQPAAVRRLERGFGYIDVPGVVGGGGSFDADAVAAIRAIDGSPMCGWVVDLRRNFGGNMWPMLHAVRPILGEGNPFTYRFGKGPGSQQPVYLLKQPAPAVAVLTSRLTVSSGEMVAIAFRGADRTRSFGEATGGLSTMNMSVPLVDGAILVLTVARPSDRSGREYDGPIPPDQAVAIDWARLGSDDDPVIRTATDWLQQEEPCVAAR
jgi:C-terminal processing protease CtpA/Prc